MLWGARTAAWMVRRIWSDLHTRAVNGLQLQ